MASKNNPKGRVNELVVQEHKGELLIYDLNNHKAYCLNPTSAIIWNLCDGNNSVADITKQAGKKLKQSVTDDLVWLAIDQFKEENLLSVSQEIEIKFDGLSRREVIRKVGFASIIALPVITSLVAPTAAMAQSGLRANCASCTTDSQCASGNCATNSGLCKAGSGEFAQNTGGSTQGNGFFDCTACQASISRNCCSGAVSGFTCGPDPFNAGRFACSGTCT